MPFLRRRGIGEGDMEGEVKRSGSGRRNWEGKVARDLDFDQKSPVPHYSVTIRSTILS